MARKDVAQIVRHLKAAGYVLEVGGSGHYKVTHALNPGKVLSLSISPSDFRWKQNFIAELRRGDWPLPIEFAPVKKKPATVAAGARRASITPPPAPAGRSGTPAVRERRPLTQRIAIPESIITATLTPKEEPVNEVKEEAPKAAFEMYVPPERKPKPVRSAKVAYITIRKNCALYVSAEAVQRLGHPERVNVSVNTEACEMMVWADTNGHLWVTYPLVKTHKAASIGATDLVRHFTLPTGTRWVEVPEASAPGRLLLRWQLDDETPQ